MKNSFLYSCDLAKYSFVLDLKIGDLESIHLASVNTELEKEIYNASIKIGNDCLITAYRNNDTLDKIKERILKMKKLNVDITMRIIITKDGRIWTDNSQSAIATMLKHGDEILVKDVPIYIIDTRNNEDCFICDKDTNPYSYNNIFSYLQVSDILNQRISDGYRPENLSWKIKDLKNQINL